jgi:hypothetical protein
MRFEPIESIATDCRRRQHWNAETIGELLNVDGDAVRSSFIHHVHADHDLLSHVDQLQRQKEIALEVNRIDDIENDVGLEDDVARNALLIVERADTVNARRVVHCELRMIAVRYLDRRSREVRNVDVESRQVIEEHRLADIRIADQHEFRFRLVEKLRCLRIDVRVPRVRQDGRYILGCELRHIECRES